MAPSYDVYVRTSQRKKERMGFQVNKPTHDEARRTAAHILDVGEDLVILEVL